MQKRVEENKTLFLLFLPDFLFQKVTFENQASFYLIYVYEV